MAEKLVCTAEKKDGSPCGNVAMLDSEFCRHHQPKNDAPVDRNDLPETGPDFSGELCPVHFPLGWPEDASSAGCAEGNFVRE